MRASPGSIKYIVELLRVSPESLICIDESFISSITSLKYCQGLYLGVLPCYGGHCQGALSNAEAYLGVLLVLLKVLPGSIASGTEGVPLVQYYTHC